MAAAYPSTPFDVRRAILFDPFPDPAVIVRVTRPVGEMLAAGILTPDARVLVLDYPEHPLVFHAAPLIYQHVVQGEIDGMPWMLAFCSICNAGTCFSPVVNGRRLTFDARGYYDAMTMLGDMETGSYWDLISGRCLHGALEGTQLTRLGNLLHMRAADALAAFPQARAALVDLTAEEAVYAEEDMIWSREAEPAWGEWESTLGVEDTRLPRLAMGLGVWTDRIKRYYPLTELNARDNVICDQIDGRDVVIFMSPASDSPAAMYVSARSGVWFGDELRLNTGQIVRDSALYNRDGEWITVERPLQLFQRWYGFALKFPQCELYSG